MSQIHKSAWSLVLLSAVLQILIFPLPNLYMLCWVAITPLLIAILRARQAQTLQLRAGIKLLPASPLQAFLLAYACGILWYAGTCYWFQRNASPSRIAAVIFGSVQDNGIRLIEKFLC